MLHFQEVELQASGVHTDRRTFMSSGEENSSKRKKRYFDVQRRRFTPRQIERRSRQALLKENNEASFSAGWRRKLKMETSAEE